MADKLLSEDKAAYLKNRRRKRVIHFIFQIVLTLVCAALAAIGFFQKVTMQENAMEPTIEVGDSFFVNRAIYKIGNPERGDIIVFRTSGSDDAALHIRRVIGLPGETVQISGGHVYINGELLEEDGDYPEIVSPGLAESSISLQVGEYFVLGDNRNNSEDSRYSNIGIISKKYIVGKIWFQVSPQDRLGRVKG